MTASLNLASISAPGQTSPLGGAPTGAAAGFDLLLAAFFGEGGQAMDPALAGLLGAQPAGPAQGVPAQAPVGAPEAELLETPATEPQPAEVAVEQASAEAALALLTVVAAAEVPQGPAVTEAAPEPVAAEPVAAEPMAWGREKAPGAPAAPALEHANAKADLPAKAADAAARDAAAIPHGKAAEAHAQHRPHAQPAPAAPPAAPVAAADPVPDLRQPQAPEPLATAQAAAETAPPARDKASKAEKTDKPRGETRLLARAEAAGPAAMPRPGDATTASATKPDTSKAAAAFAAATGGEVDAAAAAADAPADPVSAGPAPTTSTAGEIGPTTQSAPAPVRGSPETVAALAAQIVKKLEGRSSRFDLELHPADLGRVDVRLEINAQGRLTAAMSFDTPQAAAELKSRAAELQRALEQAGFDLSGGMSFDVAHDRGGQGFAGHERQEFNGFRGRAFQAALETAGDADAPPVGGLQLRQGVRSGVDVKI